jgi:hypothetical protein
MSARGASRRPFRGDDTRRRLDPALACTRHRSALTIRAGSAVAPAGDPARVRDRVVGSCHRLRRIQGRPRDPPESPLPQDPRRRPRRRAPRSDPLRHRQAREAQGSSRALSKGAGQHGSCCDEGASIRRAALSPGPPRSLGARWRKLRLDRRGREALRQQVAARVRSRPIRRARGQSLSRGHEGPMPAAQHAPRGAGVRARVHGASAGSGVPQSATLALRAKACSSSSRKGLATGPCARRVSARADAPRSTSPAPDRTPPPRGAPGPRRAAR